MTIAQLRSLIERVNSEDGAYPCKHGHAGCAACTGGRCSDEAWQQQCSDESDDAYELRMEDNDFPEEDDDA